MKTNILILIVLLTGLWACNTAKTTIPYFRTGEVEFVKAEMPGTVTLISNSNASTYNDALLFAERNIFENLFFKGVPGSPQATPFIANEQESLSVNKDFYSHFFNDGVYRRYVTKFYVIEKNTHKNGVSLREEVTIDLKALRTYLENEKIIRKFGY